MSRKIAVHLHQKPIYDILLEHDFLPLSEAFKSRSLCGHRICIVTDSHVAPLYLKAVQHALKDCASMMTAYVMPAGEAHKTLDVVRDVYEQLILHKFDRKDLLIALGGGVVGDLTGFVAATYLRGIDFVQIPTTLLSQVDSSIGGKTGVDFASYKNMVGAFKMPRLVYMNLHTLSTLPSRIYLSGMGEIIKHALIRDAAYLEWIQAHHTEILDQVPEVMEELIAISCNIKRVVVETDPTEKGLRAILNMGHTLGHAIEKQVGFTLYHGECVAIGCVASAAISCKRGLLSMETYQQIKDAFSALQLPIRAEGCKLQNILEDIKNDKKMENGVIKFILLNQIGNAYIDRTVTQDEMVYALREVGVGE